jgi:hypothetical protein
MIFAQSNISNFNIPLEQVTDDSVFISISGTSILNSLFLMYNQIMPILISNQTTSTNTKLFYEIKLIQDINIDTGEITLQTPLFWKDKYTLEDKAFLSTNLIADYHSEFYGLDTLQDKTWTWGSTDVTFEELKYSFDSYTG